MIVLVAFEFGYVTPPVALNHLLKQPMHIDGVHQNSILLYR
ncbi:hypothetical protein [Vogesella mureinivorans]